MQEKQVQQVKFFFSSRRRHTRYWRDWSSDVCSSDLTFFHELYQKHQVSAVEGIPDAWVNQRAAFFISPDNALGTYKRLNARSEERRVGKECRSRWSPYP